MPEDDGRVLAEHAEKYLSMGFTQFTFATNGPDYSLEGLQEWLAWRDDVNGRGSSQRDQDFSSPSVYRSSQSRSGSTAPNPSSPSHRSPSAGTHHNSQAKADPRIQHESD